MPKTAKTHHRADLPLTLIGILLTLLSIALFIWLGLPRSIPHPPDLLLLHGAWELHNGAVPGGIAGTATASWAPITLPGRTMRVPLDPSHERWYRHTFAIPATPASGRALLLGRIERTDQTWINGVLIGETGDMDHPETTSPFIPRLYPVPAGILRPGASNTITLRIRNADPNRHGLGSARIALGPGTTMSALARTEDMPYLIVGTMLVGLGMFLLTLAITARDQRGLAAFALATVLLGTTSMMRVSWLLGVTLDDRLAGILRHGTTFTAPALFLYFLCHSILSPEYRRLRRISRWFLLYPVIALAVSVPRGHTAILEWDLRINDPVVIATALLGIGIAILLFVRRERDSKVLLVSMGIFAATVIFEVLTGVFEWHLPRRMHLAGLLIMVEGFAIVLARRLDRLRRETREANAGLKRLNETLEEQVRKRTRQLELSRQALEENSQRHRELLNVLCHDLSNPVSSMLSLADLLQDDPSDIDDMIPILRTSATSAKETLELVKRLRFLEDAPLALAPVSAATAFNTVSQLFATQLADKQITLETRTLPDVWVEADPTSLVTSVLANIVRNAIKFSPHGSTIRLTAEADDESRVTLTCSDRGIGMPAEAVGSIFEPGRHLTRHGTDGERGTGFGMPLVHHFVRAYGGDVQVESSETPGTTGTTVRITLHCAAPPP